MKIVLNHKVSEFKPDVVPWKYQSNPATQFGIARLQGCKCFVKRQPQPFSGWGLLIRGYEGDHLPFVPKVVGLGKSDRFYYFSQFQDGAVLEDQPNGSDACQVVVRMFEAVNSINKHGFWFSDLCKKNIYLSGGHSYLIDIDSSIPHRLAYTTGMNVSYDYTMLMVRYASEIFPGHFRLKDGFSGECVNLAQLVALAVDARHEFVLPAKTRDQVMHGYLMRNHRKSYIRLFGRLLNGKPDWDATGELLNQIIGMEE